VPISAAPQSDGIAQESATAPLTVVEQSLLRWHHTDYQMKASLTLFTLSLLIGVNGAYAQQAMHNDEAGTVTYRGHLGRRGGDGENFILKIGPAHEGKSWVSVSVGRPNHCLGDVAGQATVRGDTLELTKDNGGNDCGLTIHRSSTGATIVESDCVLDHGASCSFDTQGKTLHQAK